MTAEVARKMFLERQREPDMPRAPILPSARQQELHNITHQPFQPWCEACVLGRSRQSPHIGQEGEAQEVPQEARPEPMIQIDYAYTFTKQKHEVQEGEADVQSAPARGEGGAPQAAEGGEPGGGDEPNASEPVDYRDQFGLTFFAAESSSGWISAVPILEKGAGSLKRVTEAVVRLSLQVSPCDPITVQGDPEPSVKQALNAIKACRARLGLVTNDRLVEKGSHASNGQVEKGIDTVRRSGLTLRSFLEDRIKATVEGHCHIYAWINRHAAFLHNRFAMGAKGAPAFEILFGRRYRGKLLPFGEKVIFHKATKHKGDLQWQRGIWLGVNERNSAHILGTSAGVCESRSVRRLPESEQWDAEMVLGMRSLPWSYMGTSRRKRPLYSAAGARVPLLPDTATLEEIAKAAGRVAAETIAATTPVPAAPGDEAGTDPSTSSSSTTSPMSTSRGSAEASQQQQQQADTRRESTGQLQPPGAHGTGQQQQQADTTRESAGQLQPPGPTGMSDVSRPPGVREGPSLEGAVPKRPRLLLDRPASSPQAGSSPGAGGSLYPPGYAGVNNVHGDLLPEELADFSNWAEELQESMFEESELAGEFGATWWDEEAEKPPDLSEDELKAVDREADKTEITRLIAMGVARWPGEQEDVSGYQVLTIKVVRDWRKRLGWLRRSRLVGREFRAMSAYTQELFAPASSLGAVHMFISWALSKNLQLTTIDVKDAYLNAPQPSPVTIQVERTMFGEDAPGTVTLVLDKLLPGQRIGASAWFNFAKGILQDAKLESYVKELRCSAAPRVARTPGLSCMPTTGFWPVPRRSGRTSRRFSEGVSLCRSALLCSTSGTA